MQYFSTKENIGFISWDSAAGVFRQLDRESVSNLLSDFRSRQNSVDNLTTRPEGRIGKISAYFPKKKKSAGSSLDFSLEDRVFIISGLWDDVDYAYELQRMAEHTNIDHIVYDMIPVLFPGYVLDFVSQVFEDYMKKVLPISERIFTISKNTSCDTEAVLRSWGVEELPEILDFRLGDDIIIRTPDQDIGSRLLSEDFALVAGTVEIRKNHMLIIYSYLLARDRGIDLPLLVIAGKRGWLSDSLMYLIEHDMYLQDKVRFIESPPDETLASLYSNARYVICPSFYEGWGLPVREALTYGKVTLSASGSSLDEAGGKEADYFSPYSSEELLDLMVKYRNDKELQKREKYIRSSYTPYSWQESISSLYQSYISS